MQDYLTNKILIATPHIQSKPFKHSVIYVHTDNDEMSAGVILNLPVDHSMASKWSQEIGWQYPKKVHIGGPIDAQFGYILHTNDYLSESSIPFNDEIVCTTGKGIFSDINQGIGPNEFTLMLGHCSWGQDQLANEIDNEIWTIADFSMNFFFQNLEHEHGWRFAVNLAAQQVAKELLNCTV